MGLKHFTRCDTCWKFIDNNQAPTCKKCSKPIKLKWDRRDATFMEVMISAEIKRIAIKRAKDIHYYNVTSRSEWLEDSESPYES